MRLDALNLPSLHLLSRDDQSGQVHFLAQAETRPDHCAACGSVEFYRHGGKPQAFADTPIHGVAAVIHIDRTRWRCRGCGTTVLQPLPDMAEDHMMTKRLLTFLEREGLRRTFVDVAQETGLNERTVRRVVADYIRRLETDHQFQTPSWLGLDEIHILGQPRAVIANVQARCMIDMLVNRNKPTIARYVSAMPDRQNIKVVCMDMWRPYQEVAAALLPKAAVVVDKFHVVRMASDAMEMVRKEVRKGLSEKRRRRLKDDRWILLRRERDLVGGQSLILQAWTAEFPSLGAAWKAKEAFYDIWDQAIDPTDANARYNAWEAGLSAEIRPAFSALTTAMGNWRPQVLAYFEHRATNAYTEALNGLIRVVNRLGRGYSFEVLRARMLYAHGRFEHKLNRKRPQTFQRDIPAGSIGFSLPVFMREEPPALPFGVNISTLAGLIERGEL